MSNDQEALDKLEFAEAWKARETVEAWRRLHSRPLSRVAANLRYYAAEEGTPPRVTQRLKKLATIAEKLMREPKMKLARMEDIGGVRAVLTSQEGAYRVAARLRKNWTITRPRDYVAEPKQDGYRALHLINRHRGRMIEVQLRTVSQDLWANMVEAESRRYPGLKSGGGPTEIREYYATLADVFACADRGEDVPDSLIEALHAGRTRADRVRSKRNR